MRFFIIDKDSLTWSDVGSLKVKWDMPILVGSDKRVLLGNSIKDSLPQKVIVVVYDGAIDAMLPIFVSIERAIVEENSQKRIDTIMIRVREFFENIRRKKTHSQETLFDYEDASLISEETYIRMENSFIKDHRANRNNKPSFTEEFDVDMEMLKELM